MRSALRSLPGLGPGPGIWMQMLAGIGSCAACAAVAHGATVVGGGRRRGVGQWPTHGPGMCGLDILVVRRYGG